MSKSLLLVSADTNFAKVLLYGLEQEGFRVHVTKGKGESVVRADEENCSLAFLDMDLGFRVVIEMGRALRMLNPQIELVLFSNEDPPSAMDEIRPWTLFRKPYYLPDLLNMLNNNSTPLSKSTKASPSSLGVQTSTSALPWLQDVSKAAQHLTRLTLESSAQAALITRGDHLWAYAGQLSQGAAKELATTVTRHWDGQKGSDLLRFVRLEATKAEHMLYATRLADDVVLALVFDAETPFSTIRTQAGQLVNLLSTPGAETMDPVVPQQNRRPASYYDRILIDAPCSNTGVMRRRVDLRWRIRPEEIARLSATQRELLEQAAPRLKPGATLVYSTCSLEPEENEEVISNFLARHPEFRLGSERRLVPFKHGVDGAYVANLVRKNQEPAA